MVDIVDRATRSRMMAGVRSRNTAPELQLRRALHALGFRYRLHDRRLPGSPDLVFPKWRAVIFVHGCFWHGHGCALFKWPATRAEWWRAKIEGNMARDDRVAAQLGELGWRVLVVWECEVRAEGPALAARLAAWMRGEAT